MPILDLPNWTPVVGDVALRLISRTRQQNGALAVDIDGNPTFNSSTTPNDMAVQGVINQVTRLLRPRLGEVPDRLVDSAQALAALKAAITVEQSYFTEQVESGLSPCKELQVEYMGALKDWDAAATGDVPNAPRLASLPVATLYPGYATGTV